MAFRSGGSDITARSYCCLRLRATCSAIVFTVKLCQTRHAELPWTLNETIDGHPFVVEDGELSLTVSVIIDRRKHPKGLAVLG
jgi:hypothetical protein